MIQATRTGRTYNPGFVIRLAWIIVAVTSFTVTFARGTDEESYTAAREFLEDKVKQLPRESWPTGYIDPNGFSESGGCELEGSELANIVANLHEELRGLAAELRGGGERLVVGVDMDLLCRVEAALRLAGDSEDRAYAPPLYEVVDAAAETPSKRYAWYALHCLWLLGEPPEYFDSLVEGYASRPFLAHYAMLILARNPDTVRTTRLDEIASIVERESRPEVSNLMKDALHEIKFVLSRSREIVEASSLDVRVEKLAGWAFGHCMWTGRNEENPWETRGWGLLLWARRELGRLSHESPSEVAGAFARAKLNLATSPEVVDPFANDAECARARKVILSQFLSPACRKAWQTIDPAPTGGK